MSLKLSLIKFLSLIFFLHSINYHKIDLTFFFFNFQMIINILKQENLLYFLHSQKFLKIYRKNVIN